MKTLITILLIGAAGLALAAPLRADNKLPTSPSTGALGKVLVLDNEGTFQGDIERIGDQYRIRRAVGEAWVPANRALKLCANAVEAFEFLQKRANLLDPDERLRLAGWCRQHGLRQQALNEVRAAVDLRPQHGPTRRLLAHLLQATEEQRPATTAAAPDVEQPAPLPFEVTEEAFVQFSTRVQPILMNACASCHAAPAGATAGRERAGSFRLIRTYEVVNRKVTQQNLAAVLAQINSGQPAASPFLTKAVTVHGEMTQAPFKNRQAPAFHTMEDWVKRSIPAAPLARADAVPSRERGDHRPESGTPIAADSRPATMSQAAETTPASVPSPVPARVVPIEATPSAANTSPAPAPDRKPAEPEDPYDGENFNREFHPAPAPATGGKQP